MRDNHIYSLLKITETKWVGFYKTKKLKRVERKLVFRLDSGPGRGRGISKSALTVWTFKPCAWRLLRFGRDASHHISFYLISLLAQRCSIEMPILHTNMKRTLSRNPEVYFEYCRWGIHSSGGVRFCRRVQLSTRHLHREFRVSVASPCSSAEPSSSTQKLINIFQACWRIFITTFSFCSKPLIGGMCIRHFVCSFHCTI